MKTLFPLGRCVVTPGTLEILNENRAPVLDLLARHAVGDWGDLDDENREANGQALAAGDRLLSDYQLGAGRAWITTEWDRSVTTVLLPEEY